MTIPVPLPLARRIASDLANRHDVTLLFPDTFPDSLVSDALVPIVTLAYHAGGNTRITKAQVDQSVSFTLPGVPGVALDLLSLIPPVYGIPVGTVLRGACASLKRTVIRLSPDACTAGGELLTTLCHELAHAAGIERNGIAGTLAYVVPEGRAGAEGPAYGQTLAGMVYLSGADVRTAVTQIKAIIGGYAMDAAAETLTGLMVDQTAASIEAGAAIGGPWAEIAEALRAGGVDVSGVPT